ncbi:aminoglycoside O-phosphotransferase [Actinoplanes sp. NBRC 101535]|nr:aminoglycoside O-phosphotransferase [Actinoplanes sp. NBRC 101535]
MTVPASFVSWRQRSDGEAGRRWALSLPAIVDELSAGWNLTVDPIAPMHGALSLVVLVHRGPLPLVLKMSWPDGTTETESLALRTWGGHGAVRLVDVDPDSGALLLERLDHTRDLHSVPLREAAEVAGRLIRTLAVPAPPGVRTLRDVALDISDRTPGRQRALGDPVPAVWLETARGYARELATVGTPVLIHADLHYGNVLAGVREPWLAIDARALRGTPEYSVPELIWSRADELRDDADIKGLIDVVTGAGGLDRQIAERWVVTRCVDYWLWGLEHGLTIDPVRCERILGALLP